MTRLLIGILLLFFSVACDRNKTPEGVIARKEMVPLLYDFHLAEGYLSSLPIDSNRLLARQYYTAVFEKYHTDSTHFNRSLRYYSKKPAVLDQIYGEVQERLQALQTKEQAVVDAKMRKIFIADSLRNVRVTDSLNRIKADSVTISLTKNILVAPSGDSLKAKVWSLEMDKALVKRTFGLRGSDDEVLRLLHPIEASPKPVKLDSLKRK